MKLAWKFFLSTVTILALVASLGGYALIAYNFEQSLEREVERSFEDLLYVRFSLETAFVNLGPVDSGRTDQQLASVARQLDGNELYRNYTVSLSGAEGNLIYQSREGPAQNSLVDSVEGNGRIYRISRNGGFLISSACAIDAGERTIYLQINRDISDLFFLKEEQIRLLSLSILGVLVIGGAGIYGLSLLITRPVRRLSATARAIAQGEYHRRNKVTGGDEIAGLAADFNRMAESVEEKMIELEDSARRQETFTANFAHELKTPLTSMIGYADVLRSRQLPPEEAFTCANYIYSEGKRLEALSLKLMDLIVLRRQQFELHRIHCDALLREVAAVFEPAATLAGAALTLCAEPGIVKAEPDLVRTLLLNLLDNARKAAEGGSIALTGRAEGTEYLFEVADDGRGIPPEELERITEPFYMVDKSRARRQNGSGLGLSLCSEIARLHQTQLKITSAPGAGAKVSFRLAREVDG